MTTTNPSIKEEIRLGVANACLMMPAESDRRREEIETLHHKIDREKKLVAGAKDEAGVGEHMKRLTKVHGIAKKTVQIMKILGSVEKPGDRAAIITQVGLLSKDIGYTDKDLVTLAQEAEATAGQQRDDQGSVFDKTTTGQRQGGAAVEPKHVDKPVAAAGPAPTPGIPLDEALKQLEAYNAANPPKRGAKPAERKRLEAQVEQAKAAAPATADPEPAADETDPLAEKPEAEPGQVSKEIAAGHAEADAHLKQQVAANDAPPAAPKRGAKSAPAPLDDELPPPAPRAGAHRGLGPDAYH